MLKRLAGYEASEHPDPIGVVQYPLGAAVLVELLKLARGGGVPGAAGRAFGTLVYVGHSAGSILGNGILELAPDLVDAAVMSGVRAFSRAQLILSLIRPRSRTRSATRTSSRSLASTLRATTIQHVLVACRRTI